MVLSDSSPWVALGSGTCFTVTTIFITWKPTGLTHCVEGRLIAGRIVDVDEKPFVEAVEPGHIQVLERIRRPVAAGFQSRRDRRAGRAPVGRRRRFGSTIEPGHRG